MLSALRHRDFRIYWTGSAVSFLGTWLQNTAQSWLVRGLSPSPLALGLVGFCSSVPMFVFSLFGGVLADRMDKKRALMATQAALGVFAGLLAWLTLSGLVRLPHVFAIALASGTAAALDAPLRHSLVYHLAGKDDLPAAIALNSAAFNSARIVGPALAGLVVAQWGEGVCFVLNSLSFCAVLGALALVSADSRPGAAPSSSVWADLVGGLDYIRRNPAISGLIGIIAVPSLLVFPYGALMPILAKDILGTGVKGFGGLLSAAGVGALAGAGLLTWLSRRFGRGRVMMAALALQGGALVLLAWSRVYPLSVAALVAAGFGMVTFVSSVHALLQTLASETMRGRVIGAYVFTFLGLGPLGSLAVGALAEVWGVPVMICLSGLVALIVSAGYGLGRPDIRML